jgi:dethiobiotin synthetase
MKQTVFIAGTDTDVGKTRIACGILHKANQIGLRTMAMKPVAAGCESIDGELRNSDALALRAAMSLSLPYQQLNPYALQEPASPHIAADLEGKHITNQRLVGFTRGLMMQSYDLMLIEGAGGWRVPINRQETLAGFAKTLKLPVVLVVGMRLGCLNHAMLTTEAIIADGLPLAGWVANQLDPNMPHYDKNIDYLARHIPATCLGQVPWLDNPTADNVASYLDLSELV